MFNISVNVLSPGSNLFKILLHGNDFRSAYIFEGGTSMSIERGKGCEVKLLVQVSFLNMDSKAICVRR